MSLINQDIRFAPSAGADNPEGLYSFVKPMRLVFNTVNPLPESGENEWFYVNTTTGDLFQKTHGTWFLVYNFATGGGGGGITNIQNDGVGVGLFDTLIGTTAHFKSVLGSVNEIDITDLTSEVQLSMNSAYVPPLLADLVGSKKVSGDTFSPTASVDSTLGFSVGSIWTQTGGGGLIYSCLNATAGAAVWKFIGPFQCENIGASGSSVFAQETVPPSLPRYQFRKINGVSGEIDIVQNPDTLDVGIDASYIPPNLDKVPNVFNGFSGSLFPPTVNTDSSLGYQKGSIYTQISTVPDAGHIWVCADASVGAAVWKDVSASPTVLSFDYINWVSGASYNQTITGGYQDFNFGPTVDVVAAFPSTVWSSSFDGVRQVFTKGTTTSTKAYKINFNISILDFFGARTNQAAFIFKMTRKSDSFDFPQSVCVATIPPTTDPNAWGGFSNGFIIEETTTAPVSYYFQVSGPAGHNFGVEKWSLSVNEI